jgi:hypothetical protein
MPLLPEALCCLGGAARMRIGPFLAALACGSFAMGFAFGFLGMSYLDRPATGLIVSAAIPLAVWPPAHYFLRRRPVVEPDEAGALVVSGQQPAAKVEVEQKRDHIAAGEGDRA